MQSFGGNIPSRGGGGDQHRASGGAYLAHQVEVAADGVRAIGILLAVFWIAYCLVDFDFGPVGIEFVGDHQGQSGAAAAAHL